VWTHRQIHIGRFAVEMFVSPVGGNAEKLAVALSAKAKSCPAIAQQDALEAPLGGCEPDNIAYRASRCIAEAG
jgi:hypothetical protein